MFVGERYGRLLIIKLLPNGKILCRCDCGNTQMMERSNIRSGATRSCGCLRNEISARRLKTHGETLHGYRSREFRTWEAMIARCTNPKDSNWPRYGGRGITVHPAWRDSFEVFLRDAGRRPSPRHSLDRYPNNNGNYEPGNVRWALPKDQARNMRSNRILEIDGVKRCVADWAEISGINAHCIDERLRHGRSPKDAVFSPIDIRKIKLISKRKMMGAPVKRMTQGGGDAQATGMQSGSVSRSDVGDGI